MQQCCKSSLSCSKHECIRIHCTQEIKQQHYYKYYEKKVGPASIKKWGHAVCMYWIRDRCCAKEERCTFLHFEQCSPLTTAQAWLVFDWSVRNKNNS